MSMMNSLSSSPELSSAGPPYKDTQASEQSGAVNLRAMPPSLHPPHPQPHKLKRRHHPTTMAKKGLSAILYKLRDVHRSPPTPPSPSPSTPSAHYIQRCYPPSAWPWPSCRAPRTSSFRGLPDENAAAAVFRTVNSVYDTSSEHFLRRRSSSMDDDASRFDPRSPALPGEESAQEQEQAGEEDDKERAVVRGLRSERLFFEPAGAEFLPKQPAPEQDDKNEVADVASVKNSESAATADEAAEAHAAVVKDSAVVVTVESKDPYGDFRKSMAEMVAAHGLRDWEALEELLAWYLKLNAKGVHAVIVGAFIDLLMSMQAASPPPRSPPSQSPSSSCITFEEYSSATFDDEDKS